MPHAHTYIDEHILGYRIIEDLSDSFPTVKEGIAFDF
jgi:hypothetical protein